MSMTNRLLHVDCQKRFPMCQASSMYQVPGSGRDSAHQKYLERLPVDWERVIICTLNRFCILVLSGIVRKVHSFLQLLYLWGELLKSSLAFSQFVSGEFVKSHFLSPLQFFHFMNASNVSFSKCSFSLRQFFVKPGLLSSRSFVPLSTQSISKRLERACLWNSRMQVLRESTFTFLLQDFRFYFCE